MVAFTRSYPITFTSSGTGTVPCTSSGGDVLAVDTIKDSSAVHCGYWVCDGGYYLPLKDLQRYLHPTLARLG